MQERKSWWKGTRSE